MSDSSTIPDHQLLRVIGRGSYGEVWLARSVMGTLRAVKIVRRSSFDTERPYLREFEGIRKCEPVSRSHEGLIDVLHVGRGGDDSFFYCVMELADSATGVPPTAPDYCETYQPLTLASRLERGQPLPVEDCLELAQSLAGALAQLHDAGLMHRDVKPSNIMYAEGQPKLGDIGLVAEAGESRSFVGTEGYVPAEGPGSVKADLFAMGKVLYQMLTGLDRTRYPELPDDWSQRLDFDQRLELNEIVLRACEDDPERRYRNARELLAEAAVVASGRSLKQLRQQERLLRFARWMGGMAALAACIGAVALVFSRWQVRSERERSAREESLRLRAEAAERAAQESRWEALCALTSSASHDLAPGAVTRALKAAQDAARIKATAELRSATAALLGRNDLLPYNPPEAARRLLNEMVHLDLEHGRLLHFPYDQDLDATQRQGAVEWWSLQGERLGAMAHGFTGRHSWNLVYSPSHQRLIDVSDASSLWNLKTGAFIGQLPPVVVQGFPQITTGNQIIRARPPHDLVWFDADSAAELRSLTIPDWQAMEISASPDGRMVLLNGDGQTLRLIESEHGHEFWRNAFPGMLWPPVWSPDSSRAAFRFAGLTQIVSIPDGRTWTMDTGRDRGGDNLGFLGSRHLLASSNWEDMIRIDDVSLQVPLFRLTGGGYTPTFSREHSLMGVQNWRKGARIYEWKPSPVLKIFRGEPTGILGCYFSNDSRWLFTAGPVNFYGWRMDPLNSERPELEQTINQGVLPIFDRTSPRCPIVVAGTAVEAVVDSAGNMDFNAPLIPAENYEEILHRIAAAFGGTPRTVRATQSADGHLRGIAGLGHLTMWRDGRPLPDPTPPMNSDALALSADGQWLAARRLGDAPSMTIWRLSANAAPPELIHAESGSGVWPTFSEDGRWLACGGTEENWVMDTATWTISARWPRVWSGSYGVCAFTPDGKWLITQESIDDLSLRRVGSWEIELQLKSPLEEQLRFPVVSPNGRWLAALGFRSEIYVWDLAALARELEARGLSLP